MKQQITKWHSELHEATHLISIGEIGKGQEILTRMDLEMHSACNDQPEEKKELSAENIIEIWQKAGKLGLGQFTDYINRYHNHSLSHKEDTEAVNFVHWDELRTPDQYQKEYPDKNTFLTQFK